MHQAEIIVVLFAVVAGLVLLARKLAVPYPVVPDCYWPSRLLSSATLRSCRTPLSFLEHTFLDRTTVSRHCARPIQAVAALADVSHCSRTTRSGFSQPL
jgi:hypothetical protein